METLEILIFIKKIDDCENYIGNIKFLNTTFEFKLHFAFQFNPSNFLLGNYWRLPTQKILFQVLLERNHKSIDLKNSQYLFFLNIFSMAALTLKKISRLESEIPFTIEINQKFIVSLNHLKEKY